MDAVEARAVIRFLTLKQKSPAEIHTEMVEVYKEAAPALRAVQKWWSLFKRGR